MQILQAPGEKVETYNFRRTKLQIPKLQRQGDARSVGCNAVCLEDFPQKAFGALTPRREEVDSSMPTSFCPFLHLSTCHLLSPPITSCHLLAQPVLLRVARSCKATDSARMARPLGLSARPKRRRSQSTIPSLTSSEERCRSEAGAFFTTRISARAYQSAGLPTCLAEGFLDVLGYCAEM